MLAGAGTTVGGWLTALHNAIGLAAGLVLVAVLLKITIRVGWLAMALASVAFAIVFANELGTSNTAWIFLALLAGGAVLTAVLTRYGLLPLVVALFVFRILSMTPFVPDIAHWTAVPGNWTLAALGLLVAFGFYAARGGQPLFGRILPD